MLKEIENIFCTWVESKSENLNKYKKIEVLVYDKMLYQLS